MSKRAQAPEGAGARVRVRDAGDAEREVIRDLTLRAYGEYSRVMDPSAWDGLHAAVLAGLATEQEVQRIVAERDGSVVGSVMLYSAAADAYGAGVGRTSAPELRLLAVLPEARGQGIGQALVEECVRRARAAGAAELGLHTSRSMRVAIAMYERMGFVRAPERDFQGDGTERVEAYRLPLHPGRDRSGSG